MELENFDIEQIAIICHQTNKAYCEQIGDFSQFDWDEAPEWQKESAINGVEFHLKELIKTNKTQAYKSHENWKKVKEAEGWKYGKKKDVEKKLHPCMVPFNDLPRMQQMKDYLFTAIVFAFYSEELTNRGK